MCVLFCHRYQSGTHKAVINGKQVTNLLSGDFLGFSSDQKMQEAAQQTIEKYGVGSCGPRGFYGTFDVHLNLEVSTAVSQ